MNQFLTVFEFEFLGFIKSKKNWIPAIIMAVLSLILVLP